jgi:antitoxin StbD
MHIQDHAMAILYSRQIATITELREPQKVLYRAGGKPVAILNNSQPVAYVVPVAHLDETPTHRPMTMDELQAYLKKSRERVQPVLDDLRDK